ncbi:sensor histidine kinase [Paenibacillus thermotolerans]|uniref:sensor histidine kinase n=1 Tax=Paenibacillus thermotolerans TaxID=3027807 RepID=UPI002367842D|nr:MULTISPECIES: sensor histidine kinase [unclassified Paenibacillus]
MGKESIKFRFIVTVRDKLILYALIMLLPVIMFSALFWFQSQRILEEKAGHLIDESLELSTSWLDEVLSGAVRLSAVVESDYVLRTFILDHIDRPFSEESTEDLRLVQEKLENVLTSDSRATSIWIYFPETNEVISTRFGIYSASDRQALDWLQTQKKGLHIRSWIYPDDSVLKHAGSLYDFTQTKESGNHISFIRSIPGMGSERYPVIVGVGYLEYILQDLLSEAANKTKTSLVLLNHNGYRVLSAGENAESFLAENSLPDAEERAMRYTIKDGWLINASRSKLTGWEIVSLAPLDRYMADFRRLNWLTIALTVTGLIAAVLTSSALTRSIHKPLRSLLIGMKKLESGQLSARMEHKGRDEFGLVAEGFNRMAETQQQLIKSVYEERIAKKEAELTFLTSQINPHFLYNTLGALYSLARKSDATLAEALLSVSRFFRLSLNQGKDMTTVKESMELTELYIRLMNIRNDGKYRLEAYVDPGADHYSIPALLVQPLVENAVKHGLELLAEQGTIRVTVTELKEHLLLMVMDNGKGMGEETLQSLRSHITGGALSAAAESDEAPAIKEVAADPLQGSGYALRNIYTRLELKYGSRFSFNIESELSKGTTVLIKLPKRGITE